MSKRFATIFFITVSTIIILAMFFFMILILAPGVSIFGLKYIAFGTHDIKLEKYDLFDKFGGSYEGVVINAYEAPIEVRFTEEYHYFIEYEEKFNGFTTSKIDQPSVSVTTEYNNIVVNISEYHKVLYEASNSYRKFILYVPLVDVVDDTAGSRVIQINSTKSPVSFIKSDATDLRIPDLKLIKVKTDDKVQYNTEIHATTYELETSSSISINGDISNIIKAKNYTLTSNSGKITIESPIEGDLKLKTKNGKIKLVSCANLTAETSGGDIESVSEQPVTVRGTANITTKSGNVTIGDISGEGENAIITKSGKVRLSRITSGKIVTQNGRVEVTSAGSIDIQTSGGKVYVQDVTQKIDVSTKRGNIYLGGENMPITNPTVYSRLGRVYMYSADGTVSVETASSNVEFINRSSEDITIKCGGKLKAQELKGKVNIFAEKDSEVRFDQITDVSTLEFGASCKRVEIYALGNTKEDVGYRLYGKTVDIQEYINKTFIQYEGMSGINRTQYESGINNPIYLKVTSKDNAAAVVLYVAGPEQTN